MVSPSCSARSSSSLVQYIVFLSSERKSSMVQSFRRSGTGVLHVGVDVGAGDAEVDVIYISFIVSVQYIGY